MSAWEQIFQAKQAILAVNSGSSSVKARLYLPDGSERAFHFDAIGFDEGGHRAAFRRLVEELADIPLAGVGHRIVHGGTVSEPARFVDEGELVRLDELSHLAPLHMPNCLLGVRACMRALRVPQIACYDTAFHRTMPEEAKRLPIPAALGLERFGFHGINFAYIARILPQHLGEAAAGRVVVAHLGSGASLCLLEQSRSVDTTMGLTPIGGVPMATRSGDLDPGVVIELERQLTAQALTDLLYHQCGWLALSGGMSADMKTLVEDRGPQAQFAVNYFCRGVRAAIGALAAKAGGIDALVFTGAIGEHSPVIRDKICAPLDFLGFRLSGDANAQGDTQLNAKDSKPILRLAADEERMIALYAAELLRTRTPSIGAPAP